MRVLVWLASVLHGSISTTVGWALGSARSRIVARMFCPTERNDTIAIDDAYSNPSAESVPFSQGSSCLAKSRIQRRCASEKPVAIALRNSAGLDFVPGDRGSGIPSIVCPEEAFLEGTLPDESLQREAAAPLWSGVDAIGRPVPANRAAREIVRAEREVPRSLQLLRRFYFASISSLIMLAGGTSSTPPPPRLTTPITEPSSR
jgi:hypothetical protein